MKTKSLFSTIALMALTCNGVLAQRLTSVEPGTLQPSTQLNLSALNSSTNLGSGVFFTKDKTPTCRVPYSISDADPALFKSRTIYGALINSQLWSNFSITEVPYGVYSFEMGSQDAPVGYICDFNYCFKAAAYGRDRLYGVVPLNVMGIINGARNILIDTQNWKEVSNVMFDTSYGTYSLIPCVMTYDPTDDTFYGFQYKEDLTGLNWGKYDIYENTFEQIAAYRGRTMVFTLAATPDGQMFYIDAAGDLYSMNKENGRASLVGNTGVSPTAYDQSMMYDGRTGTFLWAAECTEGSVLFSVDPQTAQTTRVMNFLNKEQFVGMYSTSSEAPDQAPAAVARPQMKFAHEGSLDAVITFTMPSKTFDGSALSDEVNLNVWLDGENIQGFDTPVGQSVSLPVTLSEGNHYVCITTDNEAGFSPIRYIYKYAGYDTPKQPTEVKFTTEDGINQVEWKAPSAGVNDGYVDFDNITYDVVLLPGEVTVAAGLKDCSFSQPTPSNMQSYYYRVYAVNNGHRSDYGESNHVLCGDSFTVPYCQSFEDPATFADFFTVYDIDGDEYTWRQGYTTEMRIDKINKDTDADDWVISPAIRMERGIKYRYTMNMKTFTPAYPEDFEILIGTNTEDLSTFRLLSREEGFTDIASEFGDYTCDFLVESSGDYHMAIRYCSKKDSAGSLIMVRSVAVDAIGNALAPAKVENLNIAPEEDGALEATISFTAPTEDLQEGKLETISKIEVYRQGQEAPVYTFTDVIPGSELECTDKDVPQIGIYTYSVTPYNTQGKGETISSEEFIGIYTAPYSTNFDDPKYAVLWSEELNVDDNDNGWYGWSWTDNDNTYGTYFSLYYYLMENNPTEIWLFSPKFKLEENTVYTVSYDAVINYDLYPDMEWSLHYGTAANSSEMTTKIGKIPSTGYFMENREHYFVNEEAGKYFIGYRTYGETMYDYFNGSIDNFSLSRRASAFAPYMMTRYRSEADKTGQLKATLKLRAPKTNYKNQNLDPNEDLTIKVYQGRNATMPKYTTTVKPGTDVTWVDEEAQHGFNYYMITCENQFGRGEIITDTIFVGRDIPDLVENFTMRATPENDNVILQWEVPSKGRNGGIVLEDEVKYNVYSYDRASDQLTLIKGGIESNSYTVMENYTDEQKQVYYALAAENTEGEGYAMASSIVLGKLYNLPFEESFANTTTSTTLWQMIPMIEQATVWSTDNPKGSYNGCDGAQDQDGGCLYMYNGSQYEAYIGALLVSPKIKLSPEEGNELHFWAYHFQENYTNNAYVQIAVTADDKAVEAVETIEVGGRREKGWIEHVINLDKYRYSDYIAIVFMGITGGYMDVIYMDNISVRNANTGGIGAVESDLNPTETLPMYDLRGIPTTNPTKGGVYIQGNQKVMVR